MTAPALTERRRAILRLIAEGRTIQQIGSELGLTERQVKWDAARLRELAGVQRSRELIAWGRDYFEREQVRA